MAFLINEFDEEGARKRVGQLNKPELEKVRDVAVSSPQLATTRRLVIAELSHAGLDNDPRERTIETEIDPNDPGGPGQINLRLIQEHTSARYIDNKAGSVMVGIYLPGVVLSTDAPHPILVPGTRSNFSGRNATPTGDRVFESRDAAMAAVKAAVPVPGGMFAYYWGLRRAGDGADAALARLRPADRGDGRGGADPA